MTIRLLIETLLSEFDGYHWELWFLFFYPRLACRFGYSTTFFDSSFYFFFSLFGTYSPGARCWIWKGSMRALESGQKSNDS